MIEQYRGGVFLCRCRISHPSTGSGNSKAISYLCKVSNSIALSPGPLGGGERAWYTLHAHTQNLRKIHRILTATTWSGRYRQRILSTSSLHFTSITLWSLQARYFERIWYGRPYLLLYHSEHFKDPTKSLRSHWATVYVDDSDFIIEIFE